MAELTKYMCYQQSQIICLPFVNASPSDYSTIYSVLKYSARNANKLGLQYCFVTFDQPLYLKAVDIVASRSDEDLSNVVVRLGDFIY